MCVCVRVVNFEEVSMTNVKKNLSALASAVSSQHARVNDAVASKTGVIVSTFVIVRLTVVQVVYV